MDNCSSFQELSEDQNFEFGKWNEETKKLAPLDVDSWQKRQETMRKSYLDSERPNVKKAVEEVDIDNLLHEFDKKDPAKRRRAAVFYVDKVEICFSGQRSQNTKK